MVLKKQLKIRFVNFFDKHDILYDCQYEVREGYSVLHSLLDVTSFGYDSIQNNEHIAMLLMDLRKACDTVSRNTLLHKVLKKRAAKSNKDEIHRHRIVYIRFN